MKQLVMLPGPARRLADPRRGRRDQAPAGADHGQREQRQRVQERVHRPGADERSRQPARPPTAADRRPRRVVHGLWYSISISSSKQSQSNRNFDEVDSEVLSPPAGHNQQKTSHGQHVTSPNSAQIGSEFLKQLPDAVRQILHGCVAPGATIDRGAHITIYVTAADPSGLGKRRENSRV